jgi:hypothetical protein
LSGYALDSRCKGRTIFADGAQQFDFSPPIYDFFLDLCQLDEKWREKFAQSKKS